MAALMGKKLIIFLALVGWCCIGAAGPSPSLRGSVKRAVGAQDGKGSAGGGPEGIMRLRGGRLTRSQTGNLPPGSPPAPTFVKKKPNKTPSTGARKGAGRPPKIKKAGEAHKEGETKADGGGGVVKAAAGNGTPVGKKGRPPKVKSA
eukprot:CAMPEP_0173412758 /NCGR_PEP_ID=MMETSP1356-20130122/80303_1 /TAXON_ID=77927 ORGANISM="Hemiselmis virescens, Strain PCC157" /NCGR_SAMPLE_ID=MMETSP1356 /ASSEMBLY_ACC=CAM_ASM_000847 /LENGTH=146 /DNA_ID=CAMNT_0014374695 /DNA_START=53 /DNA_END=493 /DNA_ORIENTATION=+